MRVRLARSAAALPYARLPGSALRHVAHDGRRCFSRFGERDRRTRAERHAPLVAMQRVLAKIGPAAARRHAHGKSTLRIVENEPVLATCSAASFSILRSVSFMIPPLWSGSAAGPRTLSGPRRMTPCDVPWHSKSEGLTRIGRIAKVNSGVRDGACRMHVASWQRSLKLTLNQRVQGSNPCAPTKSFKDLVAVGGFVPTTLPNIGLTPICRKVWIVIL